MDDTIKSSAVVFFLGAGASVAAEVPDTYSFVREFIEDIGEAAKKETIEKIVKTLKNWKESEIDVERLLETLTKLDTKDKEPLLQFFEGGKFILDGHYPKELLIKDLKDFIKTKAIVSAEKIGYLEPLRGFVEEFRPLDIISVNYDTCIEQFCNVHKIVYQDGFDVNWNPKTFATEHTDIRLYKLHGSIMWYQSDRGGYIKLPVMTKESKIELITGETAESLMLYPMQKWDYAEPFLELMVRIKQLLESEKCKFLIVVGYSFRDEHIIKILWDVTRKNRELHLIFIDPNAYQIYSEKLKYYDAQHRTPSSLDGRVVCLPYKFEKVLPYLKNYHLKNLRDGLSNENGQQQVEIKGEEADWMPCIKSFVNAEHCEKVESLLDKVDNLELEIGWQPKLELPLKMAVNLSANNQKEKASQYFEKFYSCLHKMIIERLDVNVGKSSSFVELHFNYIRHDSGEGHIGLDLFKKSIETLSEFCEARARMVTKVPNELSEVIEKLKSLKEYLKIFEEKMDLEGYINMRNEQVTHVEDFGINYQQFRQGYSEELHNMLASEVKNIEKSILTEIIG